MGDMHFQFKQAGPTFGDMRNMELLVLARVLSRPPPLRPEGNFIVSNNWVRTALKWLEKCEQSKGLGDKNKQLHSTGKKQKKSKKQNRKDKIRSRRLSDVCAPWSDMNTELTCCHGELALACTRKANASRRLMDKHAFKVLRKLYPEGNTFLADNALGCLQCRMQTETEKKVEEDRKLAEEATRKLPLSNTLIRAFYVRNKGVPTSRLLSSKRNFSDGRICIGSPIKLDDSKNESLPTCQASSHFQQSENEMFGKKGDESGNNRMSLYSPTKDGINCPLVPGVYHVIPRSWCIKWRKYIKCGGERPSSPEASVSSL